MAKRRWLWQGRREGVQPLELDERGFSCLVQAGEAGDREAPRPLQLFSLLLSHLAELKPKKERDS